MIELDSTYTVDWGDGTTEGPTDADGSPYPDGDLTHVCEEAGEYEVVVCQEWSAEWRWDGESGTIPDGPRVCNDAEPYTSPVGELQGVRRR